MEVKALNTEIVSFLTLEKEIDIKAAFGSIMKVILAKSSAKVQVLADNLCFSSILQCIESTTVPLLSEYCCFIIWCVALEASIIPALQSVRTVSVLSVTWFTASTHKQLQNAVGALKCILGRKKLKQAANMAEKLGFLKGNAKRVSVEMKMVIDQLTEGLPLSTGCDQPPAVQEIIEAEEANTTCTTLDSNMQTPPRLLKSFAQSSNKIQTTMTPSTANNETGSKSSLLQLTRSLRLSPSVPTPIPKHLVQQLRSENAMDRELAAFAIWCEASGGSDRKRDHFIAAGALPALITLIRQVGRVLLDDVDGASSQDKLSQLQLKRQLDNAAGALWSLLRGAHRREYVTNSNNIRRRFVNSNHSKYRPGMIAVWYNNIVDEVSIQYKESIYVISLAMAENQVMGGGSPPTKDMILPRSGVIEEVEEEEEETAVEVEENKEQSQQTVDVGETTNDFFTQQSQLEAIEKGVEEDIIHNAVAINEATNEYLNEDENGNSSDVNEKKN